MAHPLPRGRANATTADGSPEEKKEVHLKTGGNLLNVLDVCSFVT